MRLLHLVALGASVVATGCADPVIEMSLRMPNANQMPANFDLSCVTAVEVVIAGNDQGSLETPPDRTTSCIELATAPTSFAALRTAISGKVDTKLPQSGLAGVSIRGRMGGCSGEFDQNESVFYGGAGYIDGQESMTVPVVANISCNTKKTYAVSTVDLLALGRTKQCAMSLPTTGQPIVYAGNIRPRMMGPDFPLMAWEDGAGFAPPDAAGKAMIASFGAPGTPRSCIAMGFGSMTSFAGSCVNPAALTLCGGPGEIELPVVDDLIAFASMDPALTQQYGDPVYGAVYKASPATTITKAAVSGATVELEDPTQGTVVYVDPGANKLVPTGGTSTSASGMFMIYLKGEPATVIVKSGSTQQKYTVASTVTQYATLLAVVP